MSQMSTEERLVYMANQIARNLESAGHGAAVHATADHIEAFWDPRMKQRIFAYQARGGEALGRTAGEAIALLREKGAPPPQTPATAFNGPAGGLSDAG